MLLLDQGLPRSTGAHLSHSGIESVHVGDVGLAAADDGTILEYAGEHGRIVVTLDADFHARLALSGAARRSFGSGSKACAPKRSPNCSSRLWSAVTRI